MQTFDQHLLDLLRANKISVETALAAASNPTDFQTKLALEGDVGSGSQGDDAKAESPFELDSDGRF
jgi:Tfp pilus assembly ATPase PilU